MYVKSLVKPEITVEFKTDKAKWFPLKDTPKHEAYDKRTPGLFKVEWGKGGGGGEQAIIALCSKTINVLAPKTSFALRVSTKVQ